MKLSLPIVPPPVPVYVPNVEVEVNYVVVRGDGQCKIFGSLNQPSYSPWNYLGHQVSASNGSALHFTPNLILIPLDLVTAHRLGLVCFEEMMLPEAARAFLSLIQPHT
jgi:hypothetical protein